MNLYAIVESLHVIVAVGGLGQLGVAALIGRNPEWGNVPLLQRLLRGVSGSLVVMLLTGVWLVVLVNGVYAHAAWFSVSMLLFLAMGALTGIASATVKKISASGSTLGASPLLGKFRTLTMVATILLLAIVFLMEGKPF
jgi:uncharacterized membrane protein